MKKILIALVMLCLSGAALAAPSNYNMEPFRADLRDQESLQRGMAMFVNRCMGCHSMEYQRFARTGEDLGIPEELMEEYLILGNHGINDLMTISMDNDAAEGWFGKAPPDLTLTTRVHGSTWLYNYLRTFYRDDDAIFGVNNAVFVDVGMPHVLEDLQGIVVNTCSREELEERGGFTGTIDPLTGTRSGQCLQVQPGTGSMSPEEFHQAMYDLTNFMTYVGEPSRVQAERIGTFVLIFLAIFTFVAYLLKREYWRDIH